VRIIDRYQGFVFDLDGTVYLGADLLPGAAEVINEIHSTGKPIVYLTNKPLDPPVVYADKLTDLGLTTGVDDIVSSLDSLVTYLSATHPAARVICITEALIESILRDNGFSVLSLVQAEQAEVVVVSFDRTFDYAKLEAAFRAVRAGAVIVATNPDSYCPTPEGGLPDCAAMLAAIEASTGARAEVVLGKPSPQMARAVLERIDIAPEDLLLVGDRAATDVTMANFAGMDSALVLTGVTTREEAYGLEPGPNYVLDDLSGLLHEAPESRQEGNIDGIHLHAHP